MPQLNHFEIMRACYKQERDRVLATARERASNLEESARLLRVATEKGDLVRIAWLTKTLDVELSTRANVLHENLHMIEGLDEQRRKEVEVTTAIADDRCYCESLAHQRDRGRPGMCEVCKRRNALRSVDGALRRSAEAFNRSTPFEPSTIGRVDNYRCTTPMCGESGICDECRKRGAR